ncbi:hypothetical protein EPA93_08840 [Ktedonosporobacter rubrisoli]|uniref:HAMP domain-containing protein n=1 Tax=Ktedonosporobacter rubrisoli TaxID=2509675 RepID=A0A4P6JLL1_KTERU|nr:hypothetical protein [Ktedonosporobacter rubrisoli]QBD76109.1 hypothetical protein EPA93_08840 [Ktedonosporobacter rubrisoli]
MRNLLEALKQADQAEQIAALEYSLAENRRQAELRSQQLEEGVNAVVTTIQRVSNKEASARVDLPTSHELWPVGQQINRFLDRYLKTRGAEEELERTRQAIMEFANELYQVGPHRPFRLPPRRNTAMDAVIIALSGLKEKGTEPHAPLS